jgi:hypothetical protein
MQLIVVIQTRSDGTCPNRGSENGQDRHFTKSGNRPKPARRDMPIKPAYSINLPLPPPGGKPSFQRNNASRPKVDRGQSGAEAQA